LSRRDFTVFEDEVEQTVLSFEPTEIPFSVVILLDTSGSTLGFRQQMKFAAARFVDALAVDDRIAVASFNVKTDLLTKFTTDRRKIKFAIEVANGRNGTRLFPALEYASRLLSKEGNRRKAIVVLTDGIDSDLIREDRAKMPDEGEIETETEIARLQPEQNPSLRGFLDEAARQGITVYPLVLPSGDPQRLADPTPRQVALYTVARRRVQALADRSGGRLHVINRLEEMGKLYAEVAADLRALYSLSYQSASGGEPSRTGSRTETWRTIRVEVSRPELIARTRPGYFVR
jgi:VWFA-related protein